MIAATIHASPLSFLYDGYSAVYVFFCLSGYVLTRSFERKGCSPALQILARAVRLGLPALAATVFAAALMLMFGRANAEAGRILGSAWLSGQWDVDLSVLSILRDGTLNALLLGYRDLPAGTLLAPWQTELSHSFVVPFWTLSIEFQGSILILFLCWCARRSWWLWLAVMIAGTLFTIRSAHVCFFVGHLLASAHYAERPPSHRRLTATALVVAGLHCCVLADVWQPGWLIRLCSSETQWLLAGQFAPMQQKAYGAMLILAGVMDLRSWRTVLARPMLVALSKFSFPLYLVHWPIMCGPASAAFVALTAFVDTRLAQLCAIAVGIAASAAASVVFLTIDRYAVRLSSRFRRSPVVRPASILRAHIAGPFPVPAEALATASDQAERYSHSPG
ncbi:hypothetical protein SSBR45G_50190 [Bradyrhizobium sp. SSBR45G]|nr:hypothetical protein SSBR45G_50190 [Bradyrhizobium sp. SSBR45G]GLH87581.1 hypothetical protein SSBR45R_50410 [Bradyrhizobium sp. SSBR45R]